MADIRPYEAWMPMRAYMDVFTQHLNLRHTRDFNMLGDVFPLIVFFKLVLGAGFTARLRLVIGIFCLLIMKSYLSRKYSFNPLILQAMG